MEFALLAHLPSTPEMEQLSKETRKQMRTVSQKFVDAQSDLINSLKAGGNTHRRDEAITRTDFLDIVQDFNVSCLNRGIVPNPDWVKEIDFVETVLKLVPSKWVVRELRWVRLRNPQEKFVVNDLNDFNGLSAAVVYCDVLVTEKVRAHHLNQTGLAAQYETVVVHDLADLTDILIQKTVFG